jgi:hypothetical protein
MNPYCFITEVEPQPGNLLGAHVSRAISHKGFGYTIKLRRLATVLGLWTQGCEHNQNEV